jgi:catalase
MGVLKVTSVSPDAGGDCAAITFNPMVLPEGVEPSADPMITARVAPYSVGLGRRLVEGPKQQ